MPFWQRQRLVASSGLFPRFAFLLQLAFPQGLSDRCISLKRGGRIETIPRPRARSLVNLNDETNWEADMSELTGIVLSTIDEVVESVNKLISSAGGSAIDLVSNLIGTVSDKAMIVANGLFKNISDALLEFAAIWKDYSLSPVIGASITAFAVLYIANKYTRQLSQVSSTFEFSKRFHDIIELKRRTESEADKENWSAEKKNAAADQWWLRFFDLILTEWEFRKANYINKDRFTDWMRWRWHEYKGDDQRRGFEIFGVSYREAWGRLTGPNPLFPEAFIVFLSHIHAAPDVTKMRKVIQKQIGFWRSTTRAVEGLAAAPGAQQAPTSLQQQTQGGTG
jgi:hypothetical protein